MIAAPVNTVVAAVAPAPTQEPIVLTGTNEFAPPSDPVAVGLPPLAAAWRSVRGVPEAHCRSTTPDARRLPCCDTPLSGFGALPLVSYCSCSNLKETRSLVR